MCLILGIMPRIALPTILATLAPWISQGTYMTGIQAYPNCNYPSFLYWNVLDEQNHCEAFLCCLNKWDICNLDSIFKALGLS